MCKLRQTVRVRLKSYCRKLFLRPETFKFFVYLLNVINLILKIYDKLAN